MAVSSKAGADSGCGASAECHSFYGTVWGWSYYGSVGSAGYETADSICSLLSRQKTNVRGTAELLSAGPDDLWRAGSGTISGTEAGISGNEGRRQYAYRI